MAKQPKKEKRYSPDNFLEVFKDLGSNVVNSFKNDIINKPSSMSFSSPDADSFSNDLLQKESELEAKYKKQIRWQAEIIRKEEKILYSRKDNEIKLQVRALQDEIQQLARATNQLSNEVEVAALQVTPEAGTYHLNFFERLRNLIRALKSKIQESAFWLAEWNKKAKKRNYYWAQVRKSGSKFMLSGDRQVATQTG